MVPVDDAAIRQAGPQDVAALAAMFHKLWPEASVEEHTADLVPLLAGETPGQLPDVILVAEDGGGQCLGFVEVDLRSHADGCNPSHPVGYVEGWYVAGGHRRKGVGARLIAAAEDWARSHGCREIASDTWISNAASQVAHEALGFEVVDRCVHYRKNL